MRNMVGCTAALAITISAALPAIAAGHTTEQLTELCRPQLQAFVLAMLAEGSEPGRMQSLPSAPAAAAQAAEEARIDAVELASLRVNGINDPVVVQFIEKARDEASTHSKIALRREMKQLHKDLQAAGGVGNADAAAAIAGACIMEAMWATSKHPTPRAPN